MNSKDEIDKVYAHLSPRADKLYQFVMAYSDYINEAKDYGTGLLISMVEVHILTIIEDNPGITISNLAKKWKRTKVRDEEDAKIVHLYPTGEGVQLSTAHKLFDNMDILQTQNDLLRSCTTEEIDAFYKVLEAYYQLF